MTDNMKKIEQKIKLKTLAQLKEYAALQNIPWQKVVTAAEMDKNNAYKITNPRQDSLIKLTIALNTLIEQKKGAN